VDGVKNVDANFETHTLTVSHDSEKTSVEAMKKALEQAGFPVEGRPEAVK
jgi:copper chaperone CopZ